MRHKPTSFGLERSQTVCDRRVYLHLSASAWRSPLGAGQPVHASRAADPRPGRDGIRVYSGGVSIRVALVSMHTSPLDVPGEGDAGGMNVYLAGLADALTARGADVELLTRRTSADQPRGDLHTTPGGAPVRHLPAGPPAPVPKSELPALTAEFGAALGALPRFDLMHSHYWLSAAAALPVAEAQGIPHITSLHTVATVKNALLAPGDRPEPQTRIDAEHEAVRRSAFTIAASRFEAAAVVRDYGASESCVDVVEPGVDSHLFHPVDPAPVGGPLLLLARLQPLKGADLAIEALARIPAPARPRLVIAGGVSPGHEEYGRILRARIAALGLDPWVELLPARRRADAAELLRRSAALLVPSFSETYGIVALEAAASGVPVIASGAGGLSESVIDGVTGLLVPERDPEAWAAAMLRMTRDDLERIPLRRGALAHAASRTWDRAAEQMLNDYDRVVSLRTACA
ncbi:hypothetical protein B5808_18955 [Cnuibacter physcomitrellae]|uniref:D-inositol 3-phosphate glycosyltransferase n=1 Tax=Cnuibacter physcomitrellae TaxID=1619308 RepID=A0A1X9LPC5_9MICO|nr:hypothetical protein B5808_18955 [Cnuibacter physcomitrellae]